MFMCLRVGPWVPAMWRSRSEVEAGLTVWNDALEWLLVRILIQWQSGKA
jgi:hypothetical protein